MVRRTIAAAELSLQDTVVEVGPGLGVLTEGLVESAGRVIAVEVDTRLAERLQTRFAGKSNLTLFEADILDASPETLLSAAGVSAHELYSVVANLPYNIGSAVVRRFLEASRPPRSMVIMLQREVAESMTAEPGDLSLVGVSVQVYAEAMHLFTVPPSAFNPPPKVTSSVIRLDVREVPLISIVEREGFFDLVRAGFSAPRKQLHNSLAQGLAVATTDAIARLEAAGINPQLRPQDLSVADWLRLYRDAGV